jgi:hypothetical protein
VLWGAAPTDGATSIGGELVVVVVYEVAVVVSSGVQATPNVLTPKINAANNRKAREVVTVLTSQ